MAFEEKDKARQKETVEEKEKLRLTETLQGCLISV